MFRPFEIWVGLRYMRARRRTHFVSFMSASSMLGIALGVTSLVTVLSVMNGFERELRERILGMAAHATLSGRDGKLAKWREVARRVGDRAHLQGVAPFVEGQAMLTHGRAVRGALVRGVSPAEESRVSAVGEYMKEGDLSALRPGAYRVALGRDLARALGAGIGDKVVLMAPSARTTVAGVLPRMRRFVVAGVFEVGHAQYDAAVALVNLEDAARLFHMGDAVTGLRLEFDDAYAAPELGRAIASDLGRSFQVRDWTQVNANFFRALKTEKTVMFVILALIVAVAAFNLVSALTMVVTDKAADIAILRTLGVSPRSVLGIFLVLGSAIGVAGAMLGGLGGVGLASNVEWIVPVLERLFHTRFLSPEVYYISEVPADLRWSDVAVIEALALAMSLGATIYPAWRASRTSPATALRYE